MRRLTLVVAGVIVLLALAVPAQAGYRILSDNFDRVTGIGVVVLQIDSRTHAEIRYRDMDASYSFSAGDSRLSVRYFRPDTGVVLPGFNPVTQRPGLAGR